MWAPADRRMQEVRCSKLELFPFILWREKSHWKKAICKSAWKEQKPGIASWGSTASSCRSFPDEAGLYWGILCSSPISSGEVQETKDIPLQKSAFLPHSLLHPTHSTDLKVSQRSSCAALFSSWQMVDIYQIWYTQWYDRWAATCVFARFPRFCQYRIWSWLYYKQYSIWNWWYYWLHMRVWISLDHPCSWSWE